MNPPGREGDRATHPEARARVVRTVAGLVMIGAGVAVEIRGGLSYADHVAALVLVSLGAAFVELKVLQAWAAAVLPFVRRPGR